MKPLKYRHFFMSGGLFEGCKVRIERNDKLKWYIRKVEQEDPDCMYVFWINMRSKKRAIEVCKQNKWEVIN